MTDTALTPFVLGQRVWRPAPCATMIEEGLVIAITPIRRDDGSATIFYAAEFPTGEPYSVDQTWEHRFFGTQGGALLKLADLARSSARTCRREAEKWDSVDLMATRALQEPAPETLSTADPKELQNDGDPIKAAAMPAAVVDYLAKQAGEA